MIQFTAASKDNFFDRPAVMRFLDKTESIAFNKIGGRIRKTAQRGMRPQKKPKKKKWSEYVETPSAPGQPPRRRVPLGSGLSKIYYAYSASKHQVQIGPVKFNWSAYPSATVPELHEFGGLVKAFQVDISVSRDGKSRGLKPIWIDARPRRIRNRGAQPLRARTVSYPKRPFLFPALEKNKQFIRDTWSGASVSVG